MINSYWLKNTVNLTGICTLAFGVELYFVEPEFPFSDRSALIRHRAIYMSLDD